MGVLKSIVTQENVKEIMTVMATKVTRADRKAFAIEAGHRCASELYARFRVLGYETEGLATGVVGDSLGSPKKAKVKVRQKKEIAGRWMTCAMPGCNVRFKSPLNELGHATQHRCKKCSARLRRGTDHALVEGVGSGGKMP